MITEEQLTILMQLCLRYNVTICQEMEKRRYVLRGRGEQIGKFFLATGARAFVADSEVWDVKDAYEQLKNMPLMKFAFEDLIFE